MILRHKIFQNYHLQSALLSASFLKHRCSSKLFCTHIVPYFVNLVKYDKGLRTVVLNPLSVIWAADDASSATRLYSSKTEKSADILK